MASKTQQLLTLITEDKSFLTLLRPSWLSGFIAIVLGLALTLGTIGILQYKGSNFQYLFSSRKQQTHSVQNNYQALDRTLAKSPLLSNAPLFIFWAGIGMILYSFSTAILRSLRGVVDLGLEMRYVNANRETLRKNATERLVIRAVMLPLWILFVKLTFDVLLPYIVAMAYAASGGSIGLKNNILFAAWAIFLTILIIHIHVILVRLLLLKPRIFGTR